MFEKILNDMRALDWELEALKRKIDPNHSVTGIVLQTVPPVTVGSFQIL